jgi:hypothetical protein
LENATAAAGRRVEIAVLAHFDCSPPAVVAAAAPPYRIWSTTLLANYNIEAPSALKEKEKPAGLFPLMSFHYVNLQFRLQISSLLKGKRAFVILANGGPNWKA